MKKISILLILLALTASVFASGTRENAQGINEPGFGRINGESVSLSGTIAVTDAEVVLVTDEGSFTLSAPRARLLDLESFNDLYAAVSGQLTDCDECINGYDGHIFVEQAVVDGETYNFAINGMQENWNRSRMADDGYGRNADQNQRFGGMHDTRNTLEDSRGRGRVQDSNFGRRGSI